MTRFDLFREFSPLTREFQRRLNAVSLAPSTGPRGLLRCTLRDTPEQLTVEAQLPGIDPQSLAITVLDHTLTIAGERPQAAAPETAIWHRRERSHGQLLRTLELPAEVDPERITATCKDGLLTVTLPKIVPAQLKRIEIQAA